MLFHIHFLLYKEIQDFKMNRDNKALLAYEKKIYFSSNASYFKARILKTDNYFIWKFLLYLRKEEYYKSKFRAKKFLAVIAYFYYQRKKNSLGRKLGFDIPTGVLGKGVHIFHKGPLVINPNARIGEDCIIVGNCCIGNVKGEMKAPKLGDRCMLGWGSGIFGDIQIASGSRIGAGAVVVKSALTSGSILAGVPAHLIRVDQVVQK